MARASWHPDPDLTDIVVTLTPEEGWLIAATLIGVLADVETKGLADGGDVVDRVHGIVDALTPLVAPIGSEAGRELDRMKAKQVAFTRQNLERRRRDG